MTKDEWMKARKALSDFYSDFLKSYPVYKDGRNKAVRADAERKVDSAIYHADHYIRNNEELFLLLTGGEKNTNFGRTVIYDEFIQPRYFRNDMSDFLSKIDEEIQKKNDIQQEE